MLTFLLSVGMGTFFDEHEPHLHCYDSGADVEIKINNPTWGRTLAFNLNEMFDLSNAESFSFALACNLDSMREESDPDGDPDHHEEILFEQEYRMLFDYACVEELWPIPRERRALGLFGLGWQSRMGNLQSSTPPESLEKYFKATESDLQDD